MEAERFYRSFPRASIPVSFSENYTLPSQNRRKKKIPLTDPKRIKAMPAASPSTRSCRAGSIPPKPRPSGLGLHPRGGGSAPTAPTPASLPPQPRSRSRPKPGIAPAPSRLFSPRAAPRVRGLGAMARPEGPPTLPEPLRRRLVSFSSSVFSDSHRAALDHVPRAPPGFPGYRAGTARAGPVRAGRAAGPGPGLSRPAGAGPGGFPALPGAPEAPLARGALPAAFSLLPLPVVESDGCAHRVASGTCGLFCNLWRVAMEMPTQKGCVDSSHKSVLSRSN